MKFILILACLALYVAHTEGQRRCRGSLRNNEEPNCIGRKNEGNSREPSCRRNANEDMWYFDRRSRSCKKLSYKGCGGNGNRYCTLEACRRKCRRSRPDNEDD